MPCGTKSSGALVSRVRLAWGSAGSKLQIALPALSPPRRSAVETRARPVTGWIVTSSVPGAMVSASHPARPISSRSAKVPAAGATTKAMRSASASTTMTRPIRNVRMKPSPCGFRAAWTKSLHPR